MSCSEERFQIERVEKAAGEPGEGRVAHCATGLRPRRGRPDGSLIPARCGGGSGALRSGRAGRVGVSNVRGIGGRVA